jgi:hypothetical protein
MPEDAIFVKIFDFRKKQIICSTEGTIEINHYHTHFLPIKSSLINFLKSINGITGHPPFFLSHFLCGEY